MVDVPNATVRCKCVSESLVLKYFKFWHEGHFLEFFLSVKRRERERRHVQHKCNTSDQAAQRDKAETTIWHTRQWAHMIINHWLSIR